MFGRSKDTQGPDQEVFVLFDSKVGVYRDPVFAINGFDMMRQIERFMRDPQQAASDLVANAEDFQLFKVGEYVRKSGSLTAHPPQHLANLHEIKASLRPLQAVPTEA